MIFVAGEILFDIFEDYERIGGAPFNFAYHLKQLGLPVRFITRIGDDPPGLRIIQFLSKHHFNLEDVQIDNGHATGSVKVALDDHGMPRFDIREDVAYDYLDLESVSALDWDDVQLIYFGSLAQRTQHGFYQWQQFLARRGRTAKCFCDINLRPPYISGRVLEAALNHADILKLNEEELAVILQRLGGADLSLGKHGAEAEVIKRYAIELLALTRGEMGSVILTPTQRIDMPAGTVAGVVDTVGAGDAYAAVLAAGWINRAAPKRIATLATAFSAQVCSFPGALPPDDAIYVWLRGQLRI